MYELSTMSSSQIRIMRYTSGNILLVGGSKSPLSLTLQLHLGKKGSVSILKPSSIMSTTTAEYEKPMASWKEVIQCPDETIGVQDFSQVEVVEKLDLLLVAMNKMHIALNDKFSSVSKALFHEDYGIDARVGKMDELLLASHKRIEALEQNNLQSQNEVFLLNRTIQKQDKQIVAMNKKLTDLTARNMSNNIFISGITGDKKDENCKQKPSIFWDKIWKWNWMMQKLRLLID